MARLLLGAYVPPDPERFGPGKPIRSADIYALGMAVNKLIADPGPPPISQGWTDGQFAVSGARTLRWQQRIPEWSALHTTRRLRCRVRTAAFGGVNGVVRFESVGSGNTCDLTVGAGAGWTESVAGAGANQDLLCTFAGGYDTIRVSPSTTAGTLTIDVLQAEWRELANPLPSGASGDTVAIDEDEVDVDRPLSSRLGMTILGTLRSVEQREQVYLGMSGLNGLSYSGRALDGIPPGLIRGLSVPVHRGTQSQDWTLEYAVNGGAGGAATAARIVSDGMDDERLAWVAAAASWKTGTIELVERMRREPQIPHPWTRLGVKPENDAPTQVYNISIWGR